jgi:predicted transcriptional regulator
MKKERDLPQAEFEVMEVLWRKGEATVKEVQAELSAGSKKAYTTVATLLTRMRDKGYVKAEERNFAYVFKPLVRKDQVVRRKLDDLVKHILGGDVSPLAAYIAENRNLTQEQIAALEKAVRSDTEKEDK